MQDATVQISTDDGERNLVYLTFTPWLENECDAESDRSIERQSGQLEDEETERWRNSDHDDDVKLEEENIKEILSVLCDFGAIKDAASPDYVEVVDDLLSAKLKFDLGLRFVRNDGSDVVASIPRSAAKKLRAFSETEGHQRLLDTFDADELRARKIEEWLEEFSMILDNLLESHSIQSRIFEYHACSTDALCCDRLFKPNDYELRAHRLRRARRDESARKATEAIKKSELH